jgi:GT2 family glycosyltransferase
MPLLSIIIGAYNREALLRECLASIFQTADMAITEVVVVENGSTDGTVSMVRREFPAVNLIVLPDSVGYCVANNVGVEAAKAPYIMLLNDDAILLGDAAEGLRRYLEADANVKCVGPKVLLPNGEPQPRVFGYLPSFWRLAMQSLSIRALLPGVSLLEGVDGKVRAGPADTVGWISGVCMVMRRDDFLAAGGFDPSFYMYCEDVDLCWKLTKNGGKVVRLDDYAVRHYGGGVASSVASQLRNSRLQQRNLLKIVTARSGKASARIAGMLIFLGLLLRFLAGVALVPIRGLDRNVLLRSSLLRMADLTGVASVG